MGPGAVAGIQALGSAAGGLMGVLGIGRKGQEASQRRMNEAAAEISYNWNEKAAINAFMRENEQYEKYLSPEAQLISRAAGLDALGLSRGAMAGLGAGQGIGGGPQGGASGVTAGQAMKGHEKAGAMMEGIMSSLSIARAKAEVDNLNADTKLKDADATKTSGVDTEATQARIRQMLAGAGLSDAQASNIGKQLSETIRHNTTTEGIAMEGIQIDRSQLGEMIRHNRTMEGLTGDQLTELFRHNSANEGIEFYRAVTGRKVGDSEVQVNEQMKNKIAYEIKRSVGTGIPTTVAIKGEEITGIGPAALRHTEEYTKHYVTFVAEDGTTTIREMTEKEGSAGFR